MPSSLSIVSLAAAVLVLRSAAPAFAPGDGQTREVGRTTERDLNVVISASFGSMKIAAGESEKIVVVRAGYELHSPLDLSYAVRNRVGYLDVTLGESGNGEHQKVLRVKSIEGGDWDFRFCTAIPVSFDIEHGVGTAEFDLTGLQVKDFTLSSGAGDVVLVVNEPNSTVIDNLTIESGVSRFEGRNLGNANFRRFRFQGGVGASTLDFGGALTAEADVDVEIGVGTVTIVVPSDIGARVTYDEGWMSRFDYDHSLRKTSEHQYTTDNYASARGKLNITIDAGMGSVKIKRR